MKRNGSIITGVLISVLFLMLKLFPLPMRDLFGMEARNALFARVMLEEGFSSVPAVMGHPYPDYQPLFFWTEWLFSLPMGKVSTLTAVLPSALSAASTLLIVYLVCRQFDHVIAIASLLLLALFPDFWIRAGKASIDMMLTMWSTLAIWLFLESDKCSFNRRTLLVMGFAAVFMAFLTKGPVGVLLPCGVWFSFLVFERRWNDAASFAIFSAGTGLLCLFVSCIMWFHAGGVDMLHSMLASQVSDRLHGPSNRPFYYYFLYLLSAVAPWWCMSAAGFFLLRRRLVNVLPLFCGAMPGEQLLKLASIWAMFVFLLFNAASARAGRYLLPMFPALSIIFSYFVLHLFVFMEKQMTPHLFHRAVAVVVSIVFVSISLFCIYFFHDFPVTFFIYIALLSLVLFLVFYMIKRRSLTWQLMFYVMCLIMASGLSAESIVIEPWLSHMESGRIFADMVESKANATVPLVFFKVNRDGDAVKYAFYSRRNAANLLFAEHVTDLHNIDYPFILIAKQKVLSEEGVAEFLRNIHAIPVGQGLIHSRLYEAWEIDRSRRVGEQERGG